jgi:hypothetical protein
MSSSNGNCGDEQEFYWKFYWNVDVPGLTREQAESLVATSQSRYGVQGTVLDPRDWFTLHIDLHTAEAVRAALQDSAANDASAGFREILEDWLEARRSVAEK